MRIEDDIKLDFDDVLIRPKRSTLRSRKDVSLDRVYRFRNSGKTWCGIPIMAANMDTTGTFEMNNVLKNHKMITVLHKFYSEEDLRNHNQEISRDFTSLSIGAKEEDLDRIDRMRIACGSNMPNFLTIDVANGYGEYFADFVKRVRDRYPTLTIIAGNVVTGEMTEQLILSGADVVKVGIGGGSGCLTRRVAGVGYPQLSAVVECFVPDTLIKTESGKKRICDIKIGDKVKTHTGECKPVKRVIKKKEESSIISVNGNKSTKNHEYYVVEKQHKDILTDDNIHEYAKWIKAEDLDKEKHLLIKHK